MVDKRNFSSATKSVILVRVTSQRRETQNFRSLLAALLNLGSSLNVLRGWGLLLSDLLALLDALCFDLLLVAGFHLLLCGLELLLAFLGLLIFSSHDLVETHADDGLLYAGGLSGSALGNLVHLDLLVEASPGLGPGKLHGLLALVEKGGNFGRDEVVDLSVLGCEFTSSAGVDSVLRE